MKLSREIPTERRIAQPNGEITRPWLAWSEEAGSTLDKLSSEAAGLSDLPGSATLADVITAYNALLAALRRAAP